jgi:O-antigen ligase
MQQLVNHRWFALADLILVFTYAAAVTIFPQLGGWLIILLLVPLGIRLASGNIAYRSTSLYFILALIAVTAGIGIWAAYDQRAAWEKFWIIIGSILIFSILINQPKANLGVVVSLVGLLGVIIAIIFLLNNDWTNQSSDLGVIERAGDWIMALQLSFGDITIRPNYVGGLLAIIFPLAAAAGIHNIIVGDTTKAVFSIAIGIVIILGLFLTSSRGAWLALFLGLGAWLLWRASQLLAGKTKPSQTGILILVFSLVIITSIWILATYQGGAVGLTELLPGLPSGESRLNLALNTAKLIGDYPFTGGGLQSFPGLYSQYIMVTPYFLFAYSHNFYLDVILEQGFAGGLAILAVIVGGALVAIKQYKYKQKGSLSFLLIEAVVVSTLIILVHGFVDDPLYGETGTPLLLLIPGIALILVNEYPKIGSDDATIGDGRPNLSTAFRRKKYLLPSIVIILLIIVFFGYRKFILSSWNANLGAVEMSRSELQNWPQNKWNENPDVSSLEASESLFITSIEYSPNQRTSWHRLGLISMQRRDFSSAQVELEVAFQIDPAHRGIRKSLGYAYVWGNKLDQAERVLEGITEAKSEMEVYTWWWDENDRSDLSNQADELAQLLGSAQ